MNAEPITGLMHPQARLQPTLEALLLHAGVIAPDALARARLVQQETGEKLASVLARLGLVPEDVIALTISRALRLPPVQPHEVPEQPVSLAQVQPRFLRDSRLLPLGWRGSMLMVGCVDPTDGWPLDALRFATGAAAVGPVIMRASDMEAALERLYPLAPAASSADDDRLDEDDLERLKDLASDAPVIRAVNRLITRAVDSRASDIHIEPGEASLGVRLRIDGALQESEPLPAAMKLAFVSRIKIMAGLNIAEKRLPQDGRLRLAVRGHDIDLRVATAPGIYGESVVLRILDKSGLSLNFPALGFDDALEAKFESILTKPHGIVLVTGPTGSGKTTTLYTALSAVNDSRRKILTIEDPIEYRLPGIIQAQANSEIGFGFANALRSFLRQDPDIIMVGEVRDLETAQVAVQAALTGHLILSTLHTNSAAAAITRLLDMGIEPFLISSTLSAVLAQRLVRRLCPLCCSQDKADSATLKALGLPAKTNLPVFHPQGCAACNGKGYKGRVALLELLVPDEAIVALVLDRADAAQIHKAALAAGMGSLMADGIAKIRSGLTTAEEVLRVTQEA